MQQLCSPDSTGRHVLRAADDIKQGLPLIPILILPWMSGSTSFGGTSVVAALHTRLAARHGVGRAVAAVSMGNMHAELRDAAWLGAVRRGKEELHCPIQSTAAGQAIATRHSRYSDTSAPTHSALTVEEPC